MSEKRLKIAPLLALFVASGAAALIYEVLWLKELGRLFGVTAYATATTLGVFFLGLALGGLVWGRRAEQLKNPLVTYAALEVAIAVSAIIYLLLYDLYREFQDSIFGAIGYEPTTLLVAKFLLACGILLLPSFFMGGTLPVMAQYLVRQRSQLGSRTTLLYAVNTSGAAIGALAAGFILPRTLGFQNSYLVAIALNLLVAVIAFSWRTRLPAEDADTALPVENAAGHDVVDERSEGGLSSLVIAVAAFSGLATLALEVVWTRMFSQVLQNSVYTFSIILGVFLTFLALGSVLAHYLCRRGTSPRFSLSVMLGISGLLVALTPLIFLPLHGSLDYLRSDLGFTAYITFVFLGIAACIGPALLTMGAIFPYLMKLSEQNLISAGRTVGQLVAINTIAAIAGSLAAGFFFLDMVGVWGTIKITALAYLVLALIIWPWRSRSRRRWAIVPAAVILIVAFLVRYGDYSRIWLHSEEGESLVAAWEGAAGSVAVARTADNNLRIRVDGSYNLGSSASAVNERLQGQLPLILHDKPRSVFFLGLGTGITASGALTFPIDRVVACEINPDVIRASREHFGPWLRGLFEDPRVEVLAEDGRTWLAASRENFDVIIADIFLSFKSDAGSLYTLEHFQTVRERLNEGGIFVQWLPFFDMSEYEFQIVARTMTEVFPQVTLWRRSLSPRFPVYALIGSLQNQPLAPATLNAGMDYLRTDPLLDSTTWVIGIPLATYVTNVSARVNDLANVPLNTDNKTILEYIAPITERNSRGPHTTEVLAWQSLLKFLEQTLVDLPPEQDPFLAKFSPLETNHVRAGTAQYGYIVHSQLNNVAEANRYQTEFQRLISRSQE